MMSDIDTKPIVTLLILDDDQQFASSLADSLAVAINANCYCESDPERAMQAIDNQKIDLLIIDIHLGDRNALTLLNELSTYPDTLALPKIILSSSGSQLSIDDLGSYGVAAIYDKRTYDLADLVNKIQELTDSGN